MLLYTTAPVCCCCYKHYLFACFLRCCCTLICISPKLAFYPSVSLHCMLPTAAAYYTHPCLSYLRVPLQHVCACCWWWWWWYLCWSYRNNFSKCLVLSAHMRKPIYRTRWDTQPFGFCTLLQPTLIEHQVPAWVLQPTPWQQNRSWPGFVAELVPPIVWPTYSAIVVGVDLSSTGEAERQLANLSSHLQARRSEEGNDGLALCCFTRRCSCAPVTPSSVL